MFETSLKRSMSCFYRKLTVMILISLIGAGRRGCFKAMALPSALGWGSSSLGVLTILIQGR